jgi:hypothetical protein
MKQILSLFLLLPLIINAQQPATKQNVTISPTQMAPTAKVAAEEDRYNIGLTIFIYEGRNTLQASRNLASVVVLLATGLYVTPSGDLNFTTYDPGPRKAGMNFTGRLADTSISQVELFYQPLNSQTAEWDLVNIRIEGSATNSRTGQTFRWTVNDLFPSLQILRPGSVAVTPKRVPVRPPLWSSIPVRNLYPVLLIGNDGIKPGFQSLSFAFTLSSRPGVQFDRIIGGNYHMPQLPLQNHLFFTDKTMIDMYLGSFFIMDNRLNTVMTSDINNLGVSYIFGDHGPFENDDFDLRGMCVNYYLTRTTGYRFYTNWNINARINRAGRWMMR